MKNEIKEQLFARLIEDIREELYGDIQRELKDEFVESLKDSIRRELMDECISSEFEMYKQEVYDQLYEEEIGNEEEVARERIRKSIGWLEAHYISEVEGRKRELRQSIYKEFTDQAAEIRKTIDKRINDLLDEEITKKIKSKLIEEFLR